MFALYFLSVNALYFYKGKFYIEDSQKWASIFEQGIKKEIIRQSSDTLYIWEPYRDPAKEDFISWSISGGYLFEYYQNKNKKIMFAEPSCLYMQESCLKNFNKNNAQIIYMRGCNAEDVTNQFLSDSLKHFSY